MFDEHNAKTLISVREHMGSTLLFLASGHQSRAPLVSYCGSSGGRTSLAASHLVDDHLTRVGCQFRSELQVHLPHWPSSR